MADDHGRFGHELYMRDEPDGRRPLEDHIAAMAEIAAGLHHDRDPTASVPNSTAGELWVLVGRGTSEGWWNRSQGNINGQVGKSGTEMKEKVVSIPCDRFGGAFNSTGTLVSSENAHLWMDFNHVSSLALIPSELLDCILIDWSTWRYMMPLQVNGKGVMIADDGDVREDGAIDYGDPAGESRRYPFVFIFACVNI
ncbi:hypothetical protein HK101_008794 [Irineochytrium annulatum]|nr:hypothetical protein HK101_008794 [Irineochytrium annulatum]